MKNYVVFSLYANNKLAENLANTLNATLGKVSKTHFADGEVLVKTETDVRGKDVILVESTANKAQEKLFELLLLIDSLNRAGAKNIRLFVPYFGYSRQERSYASEPVSCEVAAKVLETANYDYFACLDLHHKVIKKFFTRRLHNLPTSSLFVDYYLNYINENHINKEDVVVVAPDHGSNDRIKAVVSGLGVEKIIMKKVRPGKNVVEHLEIKKDVTGKTCIIVDDIIDTGGTIASAANLLYAHGAHSVLVGASHAVLSGDCLEKLHKANIKDLAVTNSIEQTLPDDVHVLDIMPIILKEIK